MADNSCWAPTAFFCGDLNNTREQELSLHICNKLLSQTHNLSSAT